MTPERLAEIRRKLLHEDYEPQEAHVKELLAEVGRLNSKLAGMFEVAALRAEVEALRACRANALEDAARECDAVEVEQAPTIGAYVARECAMRVRKCIP